MRRKSGFADLAVTQVNFACAQAETQFARTKEVDEGTDICVQSWQGGPGNGPIVPSGGARFCALFEWVERALRSFAVKRRACHGLGGDVSRVP